MSNGIKAYILAGGLGTRLRASVPDLPKPLAPIHGRPFLAYLLDQLDAAGVGDAVICSGYKAELLRAHLGARHGGVRLHHSIEDAPLGTGGALRLALESFPARGIAIVLNGDSYCDTDLSDFIAWFYAEKIPAALLLVHQDDCRRFGRVEMDAQGGVRAFHEKSPALASGWINGGIYLFTPRILESLPASGAFSLERDVFPALAARGELRGWPARCRFLDIGTPESYRAAEAFFQPAQAGANSSPAQP